MIDMNRYCMPDDTALLNSTIATFKNQFYEQYHVDKFTDYISDLFSVWYVMVICIGVAFVFGFAYMFVLKCCAGIILFFSLIAIFLMIGGLGVWAYFTKNQYDTTDQNYKYLQYGAYILWGIAGFYLLILLCLCNRIRLGLSIIKTTADFVNNTPTIFIVPIVFVVIIAAWVVVWVVTCLYIFSVGDI
jgi:hypothetical protein